MTTTDRPFAQRLVMRYVATESKIHTARTRREADRLRGVLDGLGEAADIAGLAMTPFAFKHAVDVAMRSNEALEARAKFTDTTAREVAVQFREAYYDTIMDLLRVDGRVAVDAKVEV